MRVNRDQHKPIIFANCKEVLATVIMFYFVVNLVFGEEENETEFCRRKWSEFVNDKKQWNTRCLYENNVIIMTPCCVAITVYLEQRYENYIRSCPIVEGRCTCHYTEREVNHIVFDYKSKQVSWNKPNFTCPHKILLNRQKVEPNKKSPHDFSVGLHNIKYIFGLHGGRKVICAIGVSVRYCDAKDDPGTSDRWADNCTCKSNSSKVFPIKDRGSNVRWNEPCPVCTRKHEREVKEQLTPNIRPPAKLGVGEHTIIYTLTYKLQSGALRETKCFTNILVSDGKPYGIWNKMEALMFGKPDQKAILCPKFTVFTLYKHEQKDTKTFTEFGDHVPINCDACIKDILILWDNSQSVGVGPFKENVVPFLVNLVKSEILNVGEHGTHLGFISFSTEGKNKTESKIGSKKTVEELTTWLEGLKYGDLMGEWTFTGSAFKIANETFDKKSPLNHRPDVDDVILLITDGEPKATTRKLTSGQNQLAADCSTALKDGKDVKIVGLAVGAPHGRDKFLSYIKELSSKDSVFTAKMDELDNVLYELLNDTCVGPPCECPDTQTVEGKVEAGNRTVEVNWFEPKLNCLATPSPYNPNTSESFSSGKYNRTYKYTYMYIKLGRGSLELECHVNIVIKELCGEEFYDLTVQDCCCGNIKTKKPRHQCCGMKYYNTLTKTCCNSQRAILVPIGGNCR